MSFLVNWRGYGHCNTCNSTAQEPCKGRIRIRPCKGRESYVRYVERFVDILSQHHGFTIKPEDFHEYENGEIKHDDPTQ